MKKEKLITSAETLSQPGPEAAEAFAARREVLTAQVLEQMRQRPDLLKLIGAENDAMLGDNAANMSRFMLSMFQQYEPVVFVETILWVFRTYRAHGFRLTFWPAFLNTWIEAVKTTLAPETADQLVPFYQWIQINIPMFTVITDAPPTESGAQ